MKKVPIRRTDTEKNQAGDYYDGVKRYYDQVSELTIVKVFSGDCYVTNQPGEMIVTILGSCISACIRDPVTNIGGMNHFLLPGENQGDSGKGNAARFGAFAMEELINGIMKLGGKRERFEVKVFGGANVIESSAMIGTKNVEFVRRYLKDEGLRIASEDMGGDYPRRIHYFPDTGRLMMRKLRRKDDMKIIAEEKAYQSKIEKAKPTTGVELF